MDLPLTSLLFLVISIGAGISSALHALLSKRDSKSALAWVIFCLLIPIAGPLMYLLFGINRIKEAAQREFHPQSIEAESETIPEPLAERFRPLSLVGGKVTDWGIKSIEEITPLENGEAFYPSLCKDIEASQSTIYLSTYIFRNDEIGQHITDKLEAARDRGVDVRIIIDALGELVYPPRIGRQLRKRGFKFRRFNPIHLIPPSLRINMRNHRKIIVIDNAVAYTGGQNLSQRHMVTGQLERRSAQDLHFRLTGKIVADLQRAFVIDWNHCCKGRDRLTPSPYEAGGGPTTTWGRIVLDGPNENLDELNEVLLGAFSSARSRIWIMTPYFLPGFDLVGALVGARLRGVDVKILIPERTNIYFAHWATQHNLKFILGRGLEVFLQPSPFVHTKAIIIDDFYSLIGSANLDARSLRLNFEIGVEVFSFDFNNEIAAYFARMKQRCKPADESVLERRSWPVKLRDAIAWLFSPYL